MKLMLLAVTLMGWVRSARADGCAALESSETGASGYFSAPSLTTGETLYIQVYSGANGSVKVQNAAKTTTYATVNAGNTSSYLVPSTATYELDYTGTDGQYLVGCGIASPSSGTITTVASYPVTAPSAYNFGSVILSGSATHTLTFTIPTGGTGTIASVSVMTMGAPNLDFTEFGSDTCTGKSLASASTCTVTVQFQPLRAGWRKGGVLLKDSSGNILSAAYVQGMGIGAQLAYSYGSPVAYASVPKANMLGFSTATRFAVNGSGVLYLPTPPVSASDLEYNIFPSPYSGTAPSPTIIATGLNYPGYDTETGQNYNATYDPDTLGGTYAAAVDGVGNVYITGAACDCDGNYTDGIMRIDPSGNASIFYSYAVPDSGTTPIGVVQALAVGGDGTVYVFSSKYVSGDVNAGVNAFNPYTAAFSHVALSGLSFVQPYSAAIDSSANLYVSDGNYNSTAPTIYKISGTSYSVLGIGTTLAQHSSYISSIAIDSLDNLFLSDAGSSTSASSLIYVVPVSNSSSPYTISSVAGKTFSVIGSLAFDAQDNLYAEDVGVYNASTSTVRSLYYFPLQVPSLTFAAQAKGTTSAAQTLTLTNIGNAALSITVPSSGGNPSVTSTNFILTPDTDSNACVSSSTVTIPAASICARFGTCSSVTANSCTIKPASSPHASSGTTSGFVNVAGNLSSSQSSIALTGSGASGVASLSFTGLPSTTATGASQTTTVTALNSSNATLTGYTGTVTFSLQNSDPAAALPSAYTFQSTDNGTKTFPVALSAIGPQTVNVADTQDSLSASQSTTVMSAPTGATGIFGGSVAASTGYTGVYSAQMNATHNIVVMDQSSSSSFPFDALLLTGSAYVNTQVTRLSVTNANGASIDDAGDLTYCYYTSGSVRINTRLFDGTTPPTYTPTDNLYATGTSSSACSGNGAGTIYFAPGDGTLTSNVPNGSSFTQTTITGTPAGVTGLAMGYNGTLLLSATGGTYIGTISSGAWNGTLVTERNFYKFAAYQDLNGNVFLEDATTQAGYQETPHNGSYTEISWTKPFGVTAAAYSYNSSGSLAVASATAVNLQYSSSLTFPAIAVGTADPVEELVLKITAAGTLGSIAVTAPGATTDFTDAGTGTCTTNGTSHMYAVGDLCTVDVKFTPTRGGTRSGTVTVNGSTNNTVATASLTGTGIGPSVNHLSFTSIPSSATIGQSFNVTVTAYEDAAGTMVATSDNAQMSVTSSDSASVLPSNVVFTSGVATFAVTLNTTPSQTITATDLGGPVAVTSSNITVSSADSTSTSVTPSASTIGLGQTVNVTVTVHDLTHTNTTPTGGVSFSDLVGTTATSLNSGTPVSLSSGVATLTGITLSGDGVHTITATYAGVSGSFLSSSNTTTVTVGAATHFSVTATSPEVQGTSFNVTVTALDANNQAATLYAGTVKITSSDTAATLPANATLTNGVGNFTVTLNTPGSQTITATDTLTNSITGTSAAISVTAPPSFLVTVATDTTTGVATNCPNQAVTPVTGGANCSLRDALAAAATLSGTAIAVNFSPTVFLSTNTAAQNTITEVNGTLNVPSNTTIQGLTTGSGPSLTNLVTVNGGGLNSVFTLASGVTAAAINNLTITNGTGTYSGGGIYNGGTLTVNACTFSNNQTTGGGLLQGGGGIYNGGTLTVANSTFAGNSAANGGAITSAAAGTTITVTNSTFTGNQAGARGGALYLGASPSLSNLTITGNSAATGGGISGTVSIATDTIPITNSIIAANTATTDADVYSSLTGSGNIYSPSGYTAAQLALAPLGNYGGPTQTMPALPTSPAFCATYTSTAPTSTTTDQRGVTRPNHETSFYCADTGATQSSYSIVWTTQPASSIPKGATLNPVPAIQFEDDGVAIPASGAIQFNDASTSLLNHPINTTLSSTGTANLAGSSFTTVTTGDYLHAFYTLNIGTYTPTLSSAASNTFNVISIDHLTLTSVPPTATAGTSFTVTVTAYLDAAGTQVATSYTGPIKFTSTDSSMFVTSSILTLTNGTGQFTIVLYTAGNQTLTAADSSGSPSATSGTIVVSPAQAAVVSIASGSGQSATIGSAFTNPLSVHTTDLYGNIVSGTTVTFTPPSTGASATLSAPTCVTVSGACSVTATANALAGTNYAVTATIPNPQSTGVVTNAKPTPQGGTGSVSASFTLTNTQASTSLTVVPTTTAIVYGQPVTLNANISPTSVLTSVPTGSILFYDNNTQQISEPVASAAASYPIAVPTVGSHPYSAKYTGDSNFAASTQTSAASSVVVSKASTTLTGPATQPVLVVYGQGGTFPVTLAGQFTGAGIAAPSGTVSASVGNGLNESLPVSMSNGVATITFPSNAQSITYPVTISYAGDGNYNAATTIIVNVQVGPITPVVTFNPGSSFIYGTTLAGELTATISNSATGSFSYTATPTGGSATAVTATTVLTAGTYLLTANFTSSNPTLFTNATASASITVTKATPLLSWTAPAAITYGTALSATQLNATASGIGGITLPGTFTYTPTSGTILNAGANQTLSVSYVPNDTVDYTSPITKSVSITVNPGPQTITFTAPASPITYGSATAVTLTATGGGSGNPVTFTATGPGTISGSTLTITGAGSIVITANQAGSANYGAAAAVQQTIVVNKAGVIVTGPATQPVFVVVGQSATIPITVAGQYSGMGVTIPSTTVSYTILNSASSSVASGTSTLTAGATTIPVINTLIPGFYTVNVLYSGDINYNATISATVINLQIGQIQPTITWAQPTAITYGTTLAGVLNAVAYNSTTVVPGANTYTAGTTVVTAATILPAGTYILTVNFSPTDAVTYKAATASVSLTVNKATPTVSLASAVNPVLVQNSVTLTATVASTVSVPTQTVNFYDTTASTSLGTATLNAGGVATLNISTLSIGTHSITAIYSGDTNFLGAPSPVLNEQVEDFSLNISTTSGSVTSATVLPGGTATYLFTISPTGATTFPASVALSVSGLPAGATYTLTPAGIASGAGATNVTLTITVPNTVAANQHHHPFGLAPVALAMLLLPLSRRLHKSAKKLRRFVSIACILAAGAALMTGLTGCGYTTGFFAQPSHTYTITITGTAGSLTHSTTVTLTVE